MKHVSKHELLLASRMGDDSVKLINNHIRLLKPAIELIPVTLQPSISTFAVNIWGQIVRWKSLSWNGWRKVKYDAFFLIKSMPFI